MTDLEHVLGPRLHDLADHLVEPGATVPAAAAIARYRRQRRTRAGLAAVAAAVALIAIGVPTAMATLGAGRPGGTAHHGPAAPSPHWYYGSDGTETEQSLGAQARAQAAEAERQARLAELRAMSQLLGSASGPVTLTAPVTWGPCPDAAPSLSAALHTDVGYRQGSLPGGPDGCRYAAGAGANSLPQDRLAMGIGFLTGTTTAQMQAGIASSEARPGSRCLHVDTPVAPGAELQRCSVPGETRYYLDVPDSAGAGVWVLGVTIGDRYPGDPAGTALAALTQAARAAFGG